MEKKPIGTIVHVESLWKKANWTYSPCRKPMKKRPIGTIVHVESL
jgi:hypothetical protein